MPPRAHLHRTASSSSISSIHSADGSSSANTTHQRRRDPQQQQQQHTAYDIEEPSDYTRKSAPRVSSSSSLRNNYHTHANHQAFSSPPRTGPRRSLDRDDQGDDSANNLGSNPYKVKRNYRDESGDILPSPATSPAAAYRSNPFDSWGAPASTHTSPRTPTSPGGGFGAYSGTRQTSATHQHSKLASSFFGNEDDDEGDFEETPLNDDAEAFRNGSRAFTLGSSKMEEKMRANGAKSVYGRAGLAPIENAANGKGGNGTGVMATNDAAAKGKYASLLPEQAPPQSPVSSGEGN